MKMGIHADQLGESLAAADLVLLMIENPNLSWDLRKMAETAPTIVEIKTDSQQIIDYLVHNCQRWGSNRYHEQRRLR